MVSWADSRQLEVRHSLYNTAPQYVWLSNSSCFVSILDQAGSLSRLSKCYRHLANLQISKLVRSLVLTNQIAVFVTAIIF